MNAHAYCMVPHIADKAVFFCTGNFAFGFISMKFVIGYTNVQCIYTDLLPLECIQLPVQ